MVEVFLDLTAVMFMVSLNSCLVPIVSSLILDSHPICASAFLLLLFMRRTFVLIPTFLCLFSSQPILYLSFASLILATLNLPVQASLLHMHGSKNSWMALIA